jgi:hypothetical protein
MAKDPHDIALSAEKYTEELATTLAHAGVDEKVVKAVTQCADVLRQVVSALGKGQAAPEDQAPAEAGAAPAQAPPEQPAPAPAGRQHVVGY